MPSRLLLILIITALAGSLAIGAVWQSDGGEGGDGVPASRSIFPKVLNR